MQRNQKLKTFVIKGIYISIPLIVKQIELTLLNSLLGIPPPHTHVQYCNRKVKLLQSHFQTNSAVISFVIYVQHNVAITVNSNYENEII